MSEAKRLAGEKAIEYVEDGMIVGVGTGSTVAFFIDALARIKDRLAGTVSSSEQSTQRLRAHGIEVLDVHGLSIVDPVGMETALNQIPGVVSVGLFARRPADVVIVGGEPPLVL